MAILAIAGTGAGSGEWGVATLALPTDLTVEDLAVTVTADPRSLPPSGRGHQVHRAVLTGRRAAAAERLGRWDEAARAWQACANQWVAAGDVDRQALALERAARSLTADGDQDGAAAVRQRLDRVTPTWATERPDADPGAPEPFLAELIDVPEEEAS
jgi:hypothetical protein